MISAAASQPALLTADRRVFEQTRYRATEFLGHQRICECYTFTMVRSSRVVVVDGDSGVGAETEGGWLINSHWP
jgi:hypothetical protein